MEPNTVGMENHPEEMVTIRKQTFIDALLKLERQETLQCLALMDCAKQLEGLAQRIEQLLSDNKAIRARADFLNLFLSDQELGEIINEERIAAWEAEFCSQKGR